MTSIKRNQSESVGIFSIYFVPNCIIKDNYIISKTSWHC